jgi:Uma2 family endonuclease
MVMTVALAKWTLEDYHQMITAGILEGRRVELLHGEIVEMSPEGEPHSYFSDRLSKWLQRRLGERAQVREARPIVLPNDSQPEPDLAIVQPLDTVYLAHHPYPENIFWVIEYSNTTLTKDLGLKRDIYAQAGIQEYWVVNLKDLQLTVFRDLTPNGYQTELTLTEGVIAPLAFPDLQVEVQRLFRV